MKFRDMFPGVKIYRVFMFYRLLTPYQWSECHSYCSLFAICFLSSREFFGRLNPKISLLLIRDLVNAPSSSQHLACGKAVVTNTSRIGTAQTVLKHIKQSLPVRLLDGTVAAMLPVGSDMIQRKFDGGYLISCSFLPQASSRLSIGWCTWLRLMSVLG